MDDIEEQFDHARRQAEKAQAEVEVISERRLAQLLKMPHRRAARYIDDRRLTARDRTTLQRHLAKQLPTRAKKAASARPAAYGPLKWIIGHFRLTVFASTIGSVVLMAWLNTPEFLDIGVLAYDLQLTWPDRTVQPMPRGEAYAVVGADDDGQWEIRIWRPGRGYELGFVPYDALYAAR